MRIAYLDCFSGISGDMFLGALLDAGLDEQALRAELSKLPIHDWHLETRRVLRRGVSATDVTVHGTNPHHEPDASGEAHEHPHHEPRSHPHAHAEHDHAHAHEHGRSLRELLDLIDGSGLDADVKDSARGVFRRIGEAEAKIHGTTPEDIHFHEVGGLDSLIDVVGAVVGIKLLGIEEVHASRLPLSHGFIDCAHGKFPVPGPATLELLRGAPWYDTNIEGELITPTGAGILAAFCKSFGHPPAFAVERIGYGSGKTDFEHPNVLRLVLGNRVESRSSDFAQGGSFDFAQDRPASDLSVETLTLIETNIDDMNPEFYENLFERAFALGALDVFVTPIVMKKNRPAALLSVLARPEDLGALMDCVLNETTTLGVRLSEVRRYSLDRETREVATPFGVVRVKLCKRAGRIFRVAPEYEECKRIAAQANVPLREVYAAAQSSASALVGPTQQGE